MFPLVSELNDGIRWFDIILFAYKEYTNSCFCKHSRSQTASTASLVIALSLFLTSSSTCLEKSPHALAACQVARSSLHCPCTSTVSTATPQPLLSSLPASLHSFALGSVVPKCLRPFVVDTKHRNLVRQRRLSSDNDIYAPLSSYCINMHSVSMPHCHFASD